jgi:carboxybiotin decarboxylase
MDSGFVGFQMGQGIMIIVGLVLLYLAFAKGFEPLLLSPIAFGCVLANIPANEAMITDPGVMKLILAGIHRKSSRR